MCTCVCKSISKRGFPFSEWILGDVLWTKKAKLILRQTLHDAEMEGRDEVKKRGKERKVLHFLPSFFFTYIHSLSFIPTSERNECMMERHGLSLSVLSGLTVGVLREVPVHLTG